MLAPSDSGAPQQQRALNPPPETGVHQQSASNRVRCTIAGTSPLTPLVHRMSVQLVRDDVTMTFGVIDDNGAALIDPALVQGMNATTDHGGVTIEFILNSTDYWRPCVRRGRANRWVLDVVMRMIESGRFVTRRLADGPVLPINTRDPLHEAVLIMDNDCRVQTGSSLLITGALQFRATNARMATWDDRDFEAVIDAFVRGAGDT